VNVKSVSARVTDFNETPGLCNIQHVSSRHKHHCSIQGCSLSFESSSHALESSSDGTTQGKCPFPVVLYDSELTKKQPFVPADWGFVEGSPGGLDLYLVNKKTGRVSLYNPEGLTAEDLMQVPGVGKYFFSKEGAEEWIKRIAAEKQQAREKGRFSSEVSPFTVRIWDWVQHRQDEGS
jgi:hypothetical protein